jgi:hypothetical protein
MDKSLNAVAPSDPCDRRSGFHMNGLEFLASRGSKNTDEIDHCVRSPRGLDYRAFVPDIGLDERDLPHKSKRLQMDSEIGTADGHLYPAARTGEGLNDVSAQEA